MQERFKQRKSSVLFKDDKSHIGKWDEKVISLCNKINGLENYYTTSSCSGRVVLMSEQEKKTSGLFLAVFHELISFNWLKNALDNLVSQKAQNINGQVPDIRQGTSLKKSISAIKISKDIRVKRDNSIKLKSVKFKCEPPIFHVACRDLKSASVLLQKAKNSGFKHSGINSLGKNIVLEINGSDRLEFPVVSKGKIFVNDDFLKLIVEQANEKLKKGWLNIIKLEKCL